MIAIGLSNCTTQLWDVSQQTAQRKMDGHSARVSSLSWNEHILTSGSRSGHIVHHDVRVRDHVTATLSHHDQVSWSFKMIDGWGIPTGDSPGPGPGAGSAVPNGHCPLPCSWFLHLQFVGHKVGAGIIGRLNVAKAGSNSRPSG